MLMATCPRQDPEQTRLGHKQIARTTAESVPPRDIAGLKRNH